MKLYQKLSRLVGAFHRCDNEWREKHESAILKLVNEYMPSGSGIDNGTKIDLDESNEEKLVFFFGFHHMNENGYYDGWTHHKAIVTPSLCFGFKLRITGKNRNNIKDYLSDTYQYCLDKDVEEIAHA